jgi:hypothetical protein
MYFEQLGECKLVRQTEVFGENLSPPPLLPPKIPHNLTEDRTISLEKFPPLRQGYGYFQNFKAGTAFK